MCSEILYLCSYTNIRRRSRRKTYPTSLLEGRTPSTSKNTEPRMWSTIIRLCTSESILAGRISISGLNKSVSKTVFTPCEIMAKRSKPIPVSIPF